MIVRAVLPCPDGPPDADGAKVTSPPCSRRPPPPPDASASWRCAAGS